MAPKVAVAKIKNLIVSSTENGCQDHSSMLDAYKRFDKYLDQENIKRPVVVLSDGHSSRFDFAVLKFLREKLIHSFISPPDTTGVTQLLDQSPNTKLHQEYNKKREELFSPFQTINREGFMTILGEIWDVWAPKDVIINAAQRVGISSKGLDVQKMQQDKFEQAARCMETENNKTTQCTPRKTRSSEAATPTRMANAPTTPNSLSKIAKTKYRYGSSKYWQFMFEQSQKNIKTCYEKSLKLDEIPGLLTINKVKPKDLSKKSTRVTNVHGSMEGKDILERVEVLQKEKEKKKNDLEAKKQEKAKLNELFYKCKSKCVCKGVCNAKYLKQCPNCNTVMKSTCSKMACQVAGKKPTMIRPATSTVTSSRKLLLIDDDEVDDDDDDDNDDDDDDNNDDDYLSEEISENSDDPENGESFDDEIDESKNVIATIHKAWRELNPPHKEVDIIGKWFGVVYRGGKKPMLHVAKVIRRFLDDEDGHVTSVEMECLMAKVGSGDVLQASPDHLGRDISIFFNRRYYFWPIVCNPKS